MVGGVDREARITQEAGRRVLTEIMDSCDAADRVVCDVRARQLFVAAGGDAAKGTREMRHACMRATSELEQGCKRDGGTRDQCRPKVDALLQRCTAPGDVLPAPFKAVLFGAMRRAVAFAAERQLEDPSATREALRTAARAHFVTELRQDAAAFDDGEFDRSLDLAVERTKFEADGSIIVVVTPPQGVTGDTLAATLRDRLVARDAVCRGDGDVRRYCRVELFDHTRPSAINPARLEDARDEIRNGDHDAAILASFVRPTLRRLLAAPTSESDITEAEYAENDLRTDAPTTSPTRTPTPPTPAGQTDVPTHAPSAGTTDAPSAATGTTDAPTAATGTTDAPSADTPTAAPTNSDLSGASRPALSLGMFAVILAFLSL